MAVDEARIDLAQLAPSHPQPIHRTHAHIFVDDAGLAHEIMNDSAAFLRFEIDGEALLAALNTQQDTELRTAHRIAAILLDLDHTRAEVSEKAIRERSRHIRTEVEHQNTVERPNPRRPLLIRFAI